MKKFTPITRTLTFLTALISLGVMTASAAADTWNGGGSDNNWSTAGNWTSDLTPLPGDSLVFGSGVHTTPTNDFAAGTIFDGITFSSGSPAFTLIGNSILLSGQANNIATGVANSTSLAQTVSNNLTLDWGYYTFSSPSGSLSLDGSLTPNTGGVALFGGGNVQSASFTTDATGLISGLGGLGLIGTNTLALLPLATISGGNVVALPIGSYTSYASGAVASNSTANVELSASTAVSYTDANCAVNTITIDKNVGGNGSPTVKLTTTGILTLGTHGGIYVTGTGAGNKQDFELTGGNLTAGVTNVGGVIVLGINGTTTGNQIQQDSTVINNGTGPVTLVKMGPGSMFMDKANTYSGGTYVNEGYLQLNGATEAGTGPIYIASGATLFPNTASTTWANNIFISPGLGANALAAGIGALKMGNGANPQGLSGTLTVLGTPTSSAPGDRISGTGSGGTYDLSGQITGTGTLELIAEAATENFILSNVTANANNWTGGLIIDGNNNDSCFVKIGANNELAGNNVTIIQAGTGTVRLDLNGFNDKIGGLNSSGTSALNEMADFAAAPSILTLGANNASGSFSGVIGGDSAPNSLSIIKIGTGTQTLSGANTYTGNTLVEGGTLALSGGGSVSSPQILVSNATFDVSTLSAYSGSSSIGLMSNGTFNVGNVLATVGGSFGISNSTLAFPLNESSAAITVSGALATGGSTNVINVTSVPGFGSYPQQFPLIKYGSANPNLVDVNNNLIALGVILPVQGGLAGYLTNNTGNSSIDLVLTTGPIIPVEPITWSGQTNGVNTGTWDILTTSNWVLTADGVTPYFYQDTSPVTFDDTAAGTTNINLTKTILPGGVTFSNASKIYTLSGSGKISGTTGLTNNGSGTVILKESGGDNFSAGITVNNGTVVIDNNSGGISGGLTINGGTAQLGNNDTNGVLPQGTLTDNGALVFNRTNSTFNFATVISGTGALINNGSGMVTISAGPQPSATTINNGIIKINGAGGGTGCLSNAVVVNTGGELDLNVNDSLGSTVSPSPITISGIVKKLNSQAETLSRPITLSAGTMATTIGGVEQFETLGNFIQTAAGTTNFINGPGKFGLRGSSCYISNQPNSTLIISCVIETNSNSGGNTAPLNKYGSGTLILSGNNTYTGGTTINGGILQAGTAGDTTALTALGTGPVSMTGNSILNFASSKGVTVTNAISDDGLSNTVVLVSSGTNILGGADTYTGNTLVQNSVLALTGSGSINSSASIIVSNATLDISTSSSLFSNPNTLSLTNSTFNVGTNLVTALNSLAISTTTLIFPVNSASMPNITLTGTLGILTTGGTTNVINLTAVPGFLYYPTNIPLIKYTAADANLVDVNNNLNTLGLILPSLGSPVGYLTNNVANSSIDLVVLSDTLTPIFPITWSGQTNGVNTGNWDILTTPDWVFTSDGVTPYKYQDTSAVTFDDTAPGTTNINLTTTVSPGSLTISNASKTYTFSGTGKISGGVGLVKLDSGTAIFAETNGDNFSGGVTVGGGTLVLSNANANIAGGMTVNGGSLIDEHGGTISGGITVNSGSLIDEQSGTIAGGLTLNGGTALLDQAGSISGNLNINSGTVQVGNNDANGNLPSGTIADGDTLIFNRSDSALNVGAVISGGGTVENNGTGTVTLAAIETLTGPVVVNAGTLAVNESVNGNPDGISASSSLTINTNATFMFESDNAGFGTAASGSVPVTINAGGTLTGLSSADGGNGTSSHIPNVLTLNGGTLAMQGPPAALPSHGSWDLYGGVTVNSGPNCLTTSTISALGVIPTQSGGTHFDVTASPGGTPSGIDLLVSGSLIDGTAGGVFVGSGIILNPNSETGVMALDNNNTFLGGVTIDGGMLQLGTASDTSALTEPMGPGTVTINNAGSVLKFASSVGVTVSNVISDDNLGDALVLVSSGTNILTAANNYTAPTVISNGTLIVNGSLAAASTVAVLASGTLAGNGTVGGNVTNSGTIVPGTTTTIGLLTCSANVTNYGNSTSLMKLNKSASPSNDVLVVTGTLVYGGTLKVLNLGGAFAAGDSFQLFTASSYSGTFSATNLPSLGSNLGWNWNPANGTLSVVSTGPGTFTNSPGVTSFSLNGNNIVITGTNAQAGDAYYLLQSTNVALPLSQWNVVATNVVGASGNFTFTGTNAVTPGDAQQFYILSNTNSNH